MKPGQLNTSIPSFTMMDVCWIFTHAKILLESVGRFPWAEKLHRFCLYWVAMIQKISHTGKQRNSSPVLHIFAECILWSILCCGIRWWHVKIHSGKFVVQFLSCKMSSNKPHVHIARGWWKGWCFPHGKEGFVGCHIPVSQDSTSKLSAWLRKDFWKHSEHFALNAALQFL